jgi:hypothetical protein
VHAIQFHGDLDNSDIARLIGAEIASANDAGAGLIVMSLDGHRWRTDVVATIADFMAASSAPVVVLLSDPKDHRVGAGEAALGLCASSCWIDPKTTIRSGPTDDRRELAPRGADFDKAERQLTAAAAIGQQARGADTRLPGLLIAPAASMIAQRPDNGGPWLLAPGFVHDSSLPQGAITVAEVKTGDQGVAVNITAQCAVDLRIARATAPSVGDALAGENIAARPLVQKAISSGFEGARPDLSHAFEQLDRTLDNAEHTLVVDPKDKRKNTDPLYHQAGRDAMELTNKAEEEVDAAEKLTQRFPELLRQPAYGQANIARASADHETEWRKVFQKRKDRIAKLQGKARGYMAK